jgi:type III pantothenate kinase
MLLAIDAGNTNTVFAVFEGSDCRGVWRSATEARRTADEYAIWLEQVMKRDGLNPKDIDQAIIASVVPSANFNLSRLCTERFSSRPLIIGEDGVYLGIEVLLDRPEEVGADRLVNAVAAYDTIGGPLIVVDFGTATTFDVVDADGNYRGGAIAPGVNLSLEALHQAAARLPKVDIVRPPLVIGKTTVSVMQAGIFWGYVGLIEGLVGRMRAEMIGASIGAPRAVVATGGLATLFSQATTAIDRTDDDLTLRGLNIINQLNRSP